MHDALDDIWPRCLRRENGAQNRPVLGGAFRGRKAALGEQRVGIPNREVLATEFHRQLVHSDCASGELFNEGTVDGLDHAQSIAQKPKNQNGFTRMTDNPLSLLAFWRPFSMRPCFCFDGVFDRLELTIYGVPPLGGSPGFGRMISPIGRAEASAAMTAR
jgi:hypothetical protein